MSFKDKPLKKIKADTRVTIDVMHNNLLNEKNNKNDRLLSELEKCNDLKLKKKIDKQINYNNKDKINYYLDNSFILSEYYDKKEKNIDNINIMFKKEKKNNIIDDYLCNIDDKKIKEDTTKNTLICKKCNNNLLLNNIKSELYCDNCGYTEYIIINVEKTSFKDPPRETTSFQYKRINHFNEWISQFQGKETTDISQDIILKIKIEINKDKLFYKNIDLKKMRIILKKLNLNKYYENIPQLMNIITGEKSPLLSRQEEEVLRTMFKEIQIPFLNNCPEDRKNFLSYSYVLHKFCELLEYDNLLQNFPLLKSREKLQQQDFIWKKICIDLKWEFIPSV